MALDDFHVITAPAVHSLVSWLLQHLPPTAQVAIGSRADPPLGLARLRVRGELAEVRAADLAFSLSEVAEFLHALAAPGAATPAAPGVAEGARRVDGGLGGRAPTGDPRPRPAAAPAARAQALADVRARAAGSRRHIFEFLAEEVLAHQPMEVQEFLLETSVLERLAADLCAAVTGRPDAAALLERLDAADLFLTALDPERRWYRYHHLFAEFLRLRLEQRHPDRAQELHRRAAHWFAEAGPAAGVSTASVTAAIDHALAGQDYDLAAQLFVEQAWLALTARAEVATILRWVPLFPDKSLAAHPELPVYFARACFMASLPDEAARWFERAGRILDGLPPDYPGLPGMRGLYLSSRATFAAYRGDLRAGLEYAHAAEPLIPAGDGLAAARVQAASGLCLNMLGDVDGAQHAFEISLAAAQAAGHTVLAFDALHHLAVADIYRGRLHSAARRCEEALAPFADTARRVQPVGMALMALGHVRYHWNELTVAEELLAESLELARRSGHVDMAWLARLYLVPVKRAQRDAAALGELAHTLTLARTHPSRFLASNLAAARASALLALGELAEAQRWAEDYLQAPAPEFQRENEELVLARVLLADGRAELALGRLRTGRATAEEAGRHGRAVEFRVLEAQALVASGRTREAIATLRVALERAEPEGYVRVFIDDGTPMVGLLAAARAEGITPEYITRLLAAAGGGDSFAGSRSVGAGRVVESLSPRELEILGLIARGATNRDVADTLVITVGTVKSHLNRIMGKLDARNRTEAVARARALGLVA